MKKEIENRIIAIVNEYAADGCMLPLKIAIEELLAPKKHKKWQRNYHVECTICSRSFMNEAGMKIHRSYVHYKSVKTRNAIIARRNDPLAILLENASQRKTK